MSIKRVGILFIALAVALLAAASAPAGDRETLVVDRDGVQCPNADYTSIQAAVSAARPGDRIRVCPDTYNEAVVVNKPVVIEATSKPDIGSCSSPAPADPTRNAIVDGVNFSFKLQANGVTVDGFVIQGNATSGIRTSDAYSGYVIRNNVAQSNSVSGLNLLSSGAHESRVTRNCLRLNDSGAQSEVDLGSDLRNIRIDHNVTYQNRGGIDISGAGARSDVTIDHNTSSGEVVSFFIDNSTDSELSDNVSVFNQANSIAIGGGNTGLEVSHNTIEPGAPGSGSGLFVEVAYGVPSFPAPNVDIEVTHNVVHGRTRGIRVLNDSAVDSVFAQNSTFDNLAEGMRIQAGNTRNLVAGNNSNRNGTYGIRLSGATGNLLVRNSMFDNGVVDARDENRPSNTWRGNRCNTDDPPGTICGVG
jgi:hypothetical protein